jgi:pimeloyl-ACP methyl ester carboxylesterase
MSSRRILTKFGVIDALQNGKSEKAAILWVPGFLGTMASVFQQCRRNFDSCCRTAWKRRRCKSGIMTSFSKLCGGLIILALENPLVIWKGRNQDFYFFVPNFLSRNFLSENVWFSTFGQTFENWMSDAGAVLEAAAESGGPVNIVGSSMGGLISLHLAAVGSSLQQAQYCNEASTRASAIAVPLRPSCSLPQGPNRASSPKPWRRHYDSCWLPPRLWLSIGFIFSRRFILLIEYYINWVISLIFCKSKDENRTHKTESIPKTFLEGVEESWLEEIDFEKLRSQKLPIHVLHPELDDICPLSGSEKLSSLSGCTLEVLPGASHVWVSEKKVSNL